MLIRKFPEKYLPAYMRLAPYLACYDMRSEISKLAKAYGASERAVRDYIKFLRELKIRTIHIREMHPFGFEPLIVNIDGRLDVEKVKNIRLQTGYLVNYKEYLSTDGDIKSIMVFAAPSEIKSSILEVIGEVAAGYVRRYEVLTCVHYPISPCYFLSKFGLSENEDARKRWGETGFAEAKRISAQRIAKGDLYELGLLFLGMLDANPLAMRGEITNYGIVSKFAHDHAPWALNVLTRYKRRLGEVYDELSMRRVLGRVVLWGFQEAAPLLVSTSADKVVELHYIVSSTVASDGVMVCDDGRVYAIVPALARLTRFIEEVVRLGVSVYFVTRGVRFQIPLRLWDAKAKRWKMPGG